MRSFRAVGGTPYFVARAEGPYVWDVEGRRYIDLVQSYGAIIAGHAHPAIVAAVQEAAAGGTSYGAPTEREVELAEAIVARVPSCELVRLVSSGTEATMSAIRVARGFTGRETVVKFAGNYHGHGDLLLAESGSGVAALGLPGSAGVTDGAVRDTRVVPYNVVPQLDDNTACVIVEPIAANMGLVAPVDGFLDGLRSECDRWAPFSSSTRSSPASGWRRAARRSGSGSAPTSARSARSSAEGCRSARTAAGAT